MKVVFAKVVVILLFLSLLAFGLQRYYFYQLPKGPADSDTISASTELDFSKYVSNNYHVFQDNFSNTKIIEEAGQMDESKDTNWWLNSGGVFSQNNNVGMTNQGELPVLSRWRVAYSISNPIDTDGGYHPQNIFRFVTRSRWKNFSQQGYFRIVKLNTSTSPQRNESNGLLFFNRYQDGKTLYYAGVRVDGAVVIKKKYQGKYYTMAYQEYFPGKYDKGSNPILLPVQAWIGIRSDVFTLSDGSVKVTLYLDSGKSGWMPVLEAVDKPGTFGKTPILNDGFAGIRTDFMDVEFRNYQIEEIQ